MKHLFLHQIYSGSILNMLPLLLGISLLTACKKEPSVIPIEEPKIVVSQTGQDDVIFDQISAEVDTDYETSMLLHIRILASQSSGSATLTLLINDDDENTNPLVAGNTVPVNIGGATVYAALTFRQDGGEFLGSSGSVSIEVYECMPPEGLDASIRLDQLRLSGQFSASDGTSSITGTFTDLLVVCQECEGGC